MEQTSAKREKRKSLLRIAIPIILSSCLQISYDITDMFWVGKLGSGEVAAVGTAGFYIKLGWSLISVITIGTMVSVSHSIGAEKKDRIQHFISCGIRSTFVLGIFYALFVFMLAEPLISLFNIERPEVNTMAQNYLRISSITVLIMFMNLLFTAIIDAHGKTQFSFRAVLYGNIVNIILDPLFIFYFGLGVEGAAWATALSQGCAMMYAVYLLRHRLELTLSIKAVPHKFLRKILGIGTAPAMQRILFSLIGIAIGRIVSIWGTDAIAAQKLGLQIESLSFLLMNGLMQATSILIGQYYGERNTDMIRKCYRTSIRLGYCISIPATFIFLAFPETILSFFVNEAATIEIGSAYLRIVGFSQLFATLEILTSGAYTGQGLTKYPATVSIVFTTMRIPLALLLGKSLGMGIEGVWWSISLTSVIKGIVLYLLYHSDLEQAQRDEIMYKFKSGQTDVLVATDIVARGIDIDDISMVINFDVPRDAEDYVHRIGRTARADRDGVAITFISEADIVYFKQIEKLLEKEIEKVALPEELGKGPEYRMPGKRGAKGRGRQDGRRDNRSGNERKKRDEADGQERKEKRKGHGNRDRHDSRKENKENARPETITGNTEEKAQQRNRNRKPKRTDTDRQNTAQTAATAEKAVAPSATNDSNATTGNKEQRRRQKRRPQKPQARHAQNARKHGENKRQREAPTPKKPESMLKAIISKPLKWLGLKK